MDILAVLNNEIAGKNTLQELIDAFESMCQVPIEGTEKEQEMILFETGTFDFTGEPLFYFSLVRQYPNEEEEFCQIHMDIHYKPDEANQRFSASVWDTDIEENIFDYIKKSEAYLALASGSIYGIDVYMDET